MGHHQCWWVISGLNIFVAFLRDKLVGGIFSWLMRSVTTSRGSRYQSERTQVLTSFQNHFALEIHFHSSAPVTIFCLIPHIWQGLTKCYTQLWAPQISGTTSDLGKKHHGEKQLEHSYKSSPPTHERYNTMTDKTSHNIFWAEKITTESVKNYCCKQNLLKLNKTTGRKKRFESNWKTLYSLEVT